ncbi:MAG: sensor domain-containing diguanylate cyclase [Kofleriaceae bacterium]
MTAVAEGEARSGRPRLVVAVTLLVGLAGWAYLLAAPWLPWLGVERSPRAGIVPFAMFVLVILGVRTMALRIGDMVLSLDSVFYVAATLCLGALSAGRTVALALTIDAFVRLLRARRRGGAASAEGASYALYFGGMSGGVLLLLGRLFGVDEVIHEAPTQARIALEVFGLTAALLVSHYAIQGGRAVLRGRRLASYVREVALPGLAAEALVMPIGIVVVLVYRPDALLGFGLVCATYLLLHAVVRRLRAASADLAERVHDLELLNASGRRLASALELENVVDAVGRSLATTIPAADSIALVHRGRARATDVLVVDRFDRVDETFRRGKVARDRGALARVLAGGVTVAIDELAEADAADVTVAAGARAYLAAPLVLEGGPEGALVVSSAQAGAFGDAEQRVLEGLALQVAAALQNAHLYEMAMVDGLTGLFVRRYFDVRIAEELERSRRYATSFSVIMMDIDDFKSLNDTHGHLTGDRVLREVAAVVRDQMRGVDTAARYGGEEFAVILPRTEKVPAYNLAERIREAIATRRIAIDGAPGGELSVTASLGIAAFPDGADPDGEGADDVVRRADRALYRAKQLGKNRVELYWLERPARAASAGGEGGGAAAEGGGG